MISLLINILLKKKPLSNIHIFILILMWYIHASSRIKIYLYGKILIIMPLPFMV